MEKILELTVWIRCGSLYSSTESLCRSSRAPGNGTFYEEEINPSVTDDRQRVMEKNLLSASGSCLISWRFKL